MKTNPSTASLASKEIRARSLGLCIISACVLHWAAARLGAQAEISVRLIPHLQVVAGPGQIALEQATNLSAQAQWTVVTNYPWTFGGQMAFYDTNWTASGQRYYRVSNYRVSTVNLTNMVWVPSGQFRMGSTTADPGHREDESPATLVNISQGFWMGQYEVTQGEYRAVTGDNASWFTGDDRLPAEMVSWTEAVNYCGKLTARERAAGRISGEQEYRLPTEAEWEYACRAGATNQPAGDPEGLGMNGWGWYDENSEGMTHPPGQKAANAWGIYDLHGNVWEWCSDWYGAYPGGSVADPRGPAAGAERVRRGGGWNSIMDDCRMARRSHAANVRLVNTGLRVVLASANRAANEAVSRLGIELVPQLTVKGQPGIYLIERAEIINDVPGWAGIQFVTLEANSPQAFYDTNVWRGGARYYRANPDYPVISIFGDMAFGDVLAGVSATRNLTIQNTGKGPLTVSSLSYPAGFSGNWSGGTIAGGAQQVVAVTFAPAEIQTYSGTFAISSGLAQGSSTLTLSGKGIPPQGMVWIKPGTFTMGSPASEKDRYSEEGPQTVVTLTLGFWMSKYETTQAEYEAVMGSNPSSFTGDPQRPVEQVSWNDATNYCGKLTARERNAGRLPAGYVYRLPTEAEWEYACRAGTATQFNYGDDPDYTSLGDYAWYSGNSGSQTHPVGKKLPNAWGLYDMHGNVWEWCQDWYGSSLPGGSVTDPRGPNTGSFRVNRGGSWSDFGRLCRAAFRGRSGPDNRINILGFRAALASGQ